MFKVDRLNEACGNKFGVQCIQVASHWFSMGVCRDMKRFSMYAGVQCTQVFNLTGSTVFKEKEHECVQA